MRTLLTILLLATLGLPLFTPLLASTTGGAAAGTLPACCRKGGKHHCLLSMAPQPPSRTTQLSAPPERCPFSTRTLPPSHNPTPHSTPTTLRSTTPLQTPSAVLAQTESLRRIARDRSRQKRGPPTPLLS